MYCVFLIILYLLDVVYLIFEYEQFKDLSVDVNKKISNTNYNSTKTSTKSGNSINYDNNNNNSSLKQKQQLSMPNI